MATGTGGGADRFGVPRPKLYDDENQRRSDHFHVRTQILADDFADLASEWMIEAFGQEQVDTWGPPDTTLNPLASQTRQLTTPGLYGTPPEVKGEGPLLGPTGYLTRVGFWSRAQWLQFMTVGIGIYFRRVGVTWDAGGGGEKKNVRLTDTLVNPRDVVVWVDEYNRIVGLWHLRLRERMNAQGYVERQWLWDQWNIAPGTAPYLRVAEAPLSGGPGRDVSALWLEGGAMEGDAYVWRTPDGDPFLPWVVYRATDGGEFWPSWRRAMHSGTLRACAYWTFTSRSALFSTGEHVFIAGVDTGDVPGVAVRRGENDREGAAPPQLTMKVNPGTVTFLPTKTNANVTIQGIGPGVNLPNLQSFASMYGLLMALAEGIVSDALRTGSNPTSGEALAISAVQRREFSRQVQPLFLASDLEALVKYAWMLTVIVGEATPADGYSIDYETIPLSPNEQSDERAQLQWEEDRGQLSPIDVHMRLHPGRTREQALAALVAARADVTEVAAALAAELAKRGASVALTSTPPDDSPSADGAAPSVGSPMDGAPVAEPGQPPTQEPEKVADTAMNGAQVTAAQAIVQSVVDKTLPMETAKAMLMEFFQLSESAAQRILGPTATFDAAKPAPAVPFGGVAPPAPPDDTDTDENEEV